MANVELLQLLIAHVRDSMRDTGEFGILLVNEIDRTVAAGIEQEGFLDETNDAIIRRPARQIEVLNIYIHALKAYLLDLPQIATHIQEQFQEQFDVNQVLISLQSDLVPSAQNAEMLNLLEISEFYTDNGDRLLNEFRHIENLLTQISSQGEE